MLETSSASTATDNYASFVLGQLTCAGLRGRLTVADIESIDVALRGGFIDADGAIAWAHDIGALGFMPAAIISSST